MGHKISGKQNSSSVAYLTSNDDSKCTEKEDIVNNLEATFQKNSSSANYSEEFRDSK